LSLNTVNLVGKITDSGVKLYYKERGCECHWTLMLEDVGKGGEVFKLFVPCVNYAKAEELAASLEPGDLVSVQGKLGWARPQPTKKDPEPAGRLTVLAWQVEKIAAPALADATGAGVS
jgi:hypothetical protein